MTKFLQLMVIIYLFIGNSAKAESISEGGTQLLKTIDSLNVEQKWQKGEAINCRTGETIEHYTGKYASKKEKSLSTHCSCFAYAVAADLGLSADALPLHSPVDTDHIALLANKQADWYATEGQKHGWVHLDKSSIRTLFFNVVQRFYTRNHNSSMTWSFRLRVLIYSNY